MTMNASITLFSPTTLRYMIYDLVEYLPVCADTSSTEGLDTVQNILRLFEAYRATSVADNPEILEIAKRITAAIQSWMLD